MNPEQNEDGPLDALLQEWRVERTLPPRFQQRVWQRIAHVEETTSPNLPSFAGWLETLFSRPSVAACYVAVLLLAGIMTGLWQAKGKSAQVESQWRSRYVQSVDPYRMTGN